MSEPDADAGDDVTFAFPPMGPDVVPYFGYRDAAGAIAFLTEVLGFEVLARYEGPDGSVMHAELHIGSGIIMLGSAPSETEGSQPAASIGTYVVVDDVDAHHAHAVGAGLDARGGQLVYPPEETEFGTRRYRLRDPEGFEWSFGTYQPSLTA